MIKKIQKLINNRDKKILFIGIGNALISDDRVGIYLVERIIERDNIRTMIVENGIEKFVGKINSIDPDILVLVDCTDFGQPPGFFGLIPVEEVQDTTVNTHTVSLRRISEFFKMKTYLLGIQPLNVRFGVDISAVVSDCADKITGIINKSQISKNK